MFPNNPPAQVTGLDGQWQSKRVFREHGIVLKVQTIKILCLRAAFGFQNISAGQWLTLSRLRACRVLGRFDLIWCWDNNMVFGGIYRQGLAEKWTLTKAMCVRVRAHVAVLNPLDKCSRFGF